MRANLPSITWVSDRSNTELCALWLKSTETKGKLLVPRIPLSGPFSAAIEIASLISLTLVSLLGVKVKSISETFGVGTRTDVPSNFPFNSGRTSPTAFAAPVDVGIIEEDAVLDRCKSSWSVSTVLWSPVNACIVVIKPRSIPMALFKTYATGARQFVVQEAFEMTRCSLLI